MLVSLWQPDDGEQQLLLRLLHQHLARGPRSVSEAWQAAQREYLARDFDGGFAHPRLWAGFMLLGSP